MTRANPIAHRDREVTVLVCESGQRWCDAARRFIGPFQHAPKSPVWSAACSTRLRFRIQPVEHGKARASLQGLPEAVILWEISADNVAATAMTIAQVGVGRQDAIQIVALRDGWSDQAWGYGQRLMELGVVAVLKNPEELARLARLLQRRFERDGGDAAFH